jgi:predicted neutral ceramidase superfamily lipid hydrolase
MSEFSIFIGFFWDAFRKILKNRAAILFGILLTVGSSEYLSSLFETGAPLERYRAEIVTLIETHPILMLTIPLILGLSTFAKGGLIIALSEKNPTVRTAAKKSVALFPKLFALEMIFLLSVFIVLATLLLPAMMTQENSSLGLNLAFLGLAIFLPILLVLTFVEIYAFFHLILSKTTLRSSVELGYALFMKRSATSIVFGATSLLILIAVSLLAGIFLGIGNAFVPESVGRSVGIMTILFLIQSGLAIVQKDAWLSFFRFIGMEKKEEESPSQEQENMIQKEVPEIG